MDSQKRTREGKGGLIQAWIAKTWLITVRIPSRTRNVHAAAEAIQCIHTLHPDNEPRRHSVCTLVPRGRKERQ